MNISFAHWALHVLTSYLIAKLHTVYARNCGPKLAELMKRWVGVGRADLERRFGSETSPNHNLNQTSPCRTKRTTSLRTFSLLHSKKYLNRHRKFNCFWPSSRRICTTIWQLLSSSFKLHPPSHPLPHSILPQTRRQATAYQPRPSDQLLEHQLYT